MCIVWVVEMIIPAGYIRLNGTQKQIYYFLATSQNNPAKDPLVVWSVLASKA